MLSSVHDKSTAGAKQGCLEKDRTIAFETLQTQRDISRLPESVAALSRGDALGTDNRRHGE